MLENSTTTSDAYTNIVRLLMTDDDKTVTTSIFQAKYANEPSTLYRYILSFLITADGAQVTTPTSSGHLKPASLPSLLLDKLPTDHYQGILISALLASHYTIVKTSLNWTDRLIIQKPTQAREVCAELYKALQKFGFTITASMEYAVFCEHTSIITDDLTVNHTVFRDIFDEAPSIIAHNFNFKLLYIIHALREFSTILNILEKRIDFKNQKQNDSFKQGIKNLILKLWKNIHHLDYQATEKFNFDTIESVFEIESTNDADKDVLIELAYKIYKKFRDLKVAFENCPEIYKICEILADCFLLKNKIYEDSIDPIWSVCEKIAPHFYKKVILPFALVAQLSPLFEALKKHPLSIRILSGKSLSASQKTIFLNELMTCLASVIPFSNEISKSLLFDYLQYANHHLDTSACLIEHYTVPALYFLHMLHFREQTIALCKNPGANLPDLNINGETLESSDDNQSKFQLVSLPPYDLRILYLGKLTNCCHYLRENHANHNGDGYARYAYQDPDAKCYVIVKKNDDPNKLPRIIAQTFAYRNERGLVFNMWVRLPHEISKEMVLAFMQRAAQEILKSSFDISAVYSGAYIFPQDRESVVSPEKKGGMLDYRQHRDILPRYSFFAHGVSSTQLDSQHQICIASKNLAIPSSF